MFKKNLDCFLIAEIAQAHDGSLGILHSFIDALTGSGVNAVKFQTHIAEAESSPFEEFRVPFSYEDKTRFDYWKRMEFSSDQWKEIKAHCEKCGLEFMSSPFSIAAVDLLEELGVKRHKIGSGDVTNHLLLERIAKTGKPVILSSGMSSFQELDEAVKLLKSHRIESTILQCTSQYPTPAEKVGLNVMMELKERYNLPVGLSDHSGTLFPALTAAALGASIIEFHVTFDKRMFGPDSSSSLTLNQVKELVEGVSFIEKSLQNSVDKNDLSPFMDSKKNFGKSLAVNKNLNEGHIITIDDLESKKPEGLGISSKNYKEAIGKKINKNLEKYSFLKENDIE